MRRSSAIAPRSGRAATRMPCASDMPGSPRASEVLSLIVAGRLNKQIAGELATSERTVEFHRAHIMEKMAADSVAELVRMAAQLGLGSQS